MSAKALTDVRLRNLKADTGKRFEIWDAQVPGFGVRVSPTGTKSFVLVYRFHGHPRRQTLGRYPQLGLAEARKLARDTLAKAAEGSDPQSRDPFVAAGPAAPVAAERRFHLEAVAMEFFEKHCRRNNRSNTARETERILMAHFVSRWPKRDIRDIRRSEILGVLDEIVAAGKASAANHTFSAVRKFFNWCCERDLLETTPCTGIKMPSKVVSRARVLSDAELAAVWRGAKRIGYPFGTLVQLLMLTGQRRNEVTELRWSDIDRAARTWTIPPERNKSDRPHIVPLTDRMLDLIAGVPHLSDVFVFPSQRSRDRTFSGFSKLKKRLDSLSGVTDWTLHDLRRSLATGLARQGIPPHVIEKLLNHSTGTLSGVAGIYNRFGYLDEIRAALESWDRLCEAFEPAGS